MCSRADPPDGLDRLPRTNAADHSADYPADYPADIPADIPYG